MGGDALARAVRAMAGPVRRTGNINNMDTLTETIDPDRFRFCTDEKEPYAFPVDSNRPVRRTAKAILAGLSGANGVGRPTAGQAACSANTVRPLALTSAKPPWIAIVSGWPPSVR